MQSASGIATSLIDGLGVGGIGLGVFFNGLGIPGLGEVLLPLGAVAARQGKISLVVLVIVAFTAQMLGLTAAYLLARYGGVALIEKYGKYVLISHRELKMSQNAFDKYGKWLVLFGAFIPGIQGFIGYVAGLAEMNFARFFFSALAGKIVWIGGLLYLGTVLGNHLELIDRSIRQIGVVVLAAVIVGVIWLIITKRKRKGTVIEG